MLSSEKKYCQPRNNFLFHFAVSFCFSSGEAFFFSWLFKTKNSQFNNFLAVYTFRIVRQVSISRFLCNRPYGFSKSLFHFQFSSLHFLYVSAANVHYSYIGQIPRRQTHPRRSLITIKTIACKSIR